MNTDSGPVSHLWYLDRLYSDLSWAKAQLNGREKAKLSEVEWNYVQGLLAGSSPAEIAQRWHVVSGTVRGVLCDVIYPCVKLLSRHHTNQEACIRQWSDVSPVLERLGYRNYCVQGDDASPTWTSCWEGSPEVEVLFGRDQELHHLQQGFLSEQHKVITLTGVEGIGKTALAVTLAKDLEQQHNYQVLWISMTTASTPEAVLTKIQRLWGVQTLPTQLTLEAYWQQLLQQLPDHPWLVVLDGMETTLENRKYTTQHQSYKTLFRQVCSTNHPGQFLVTSSQSITNLCVLEEQGFSVRLCRISGLSQHAIGKLLEHLNVECHHAQACEQVRRIYNGNPQFIRFLATSIREIFNGRLVCFTELNTILLDEQMQLLLDMQWQRLSSLEQRITRILAEAETTLSVPELREALDNLESTGLLINSIRHLKECEFIEQVIGATKDEGRYQLRLLIQKYLADYLN